MKEFYEKSLQKIKAAKEKLLSSESLKYISQKEFEELSEEVRAS